MTGFERVGPFTFHVYFDDGADQVIDFRPVLWGEIFEPLWGSEYFDRVRLDSEPGTLVWPNGADFDPETLHNWPRHVDDFARQPAGHVVESEG